MKYSHEVQPAKLVTMKIPRFSLRDLFWLTAVVALAVAWVVSMKREKALELENLSNLAKLKEMTAHRDEVRAYLREEGLAIQHAGIIHSHVNGKIVLKLPTPEPPPNSSAPAPNPPK